MMGTMLNQLDAPSRTNELHRHHLTRLTACPVDHRQTCTPQADETVWPAEADFILSALETGQDIEPLERRSSNRLIHRTLAELHLYSDRPGDEPWMLCTRDATTRSLGFISRRRPPLGYGGTIQLRGPNAEQLSIACTVRRCHETVSGWYEGSISFNREQWAFDRLNTSDAD